MWHSENTNKNHVERSPGTNCFVNAESVCTLLLAKPIFGTPFLSNDLTFDHVQLQK